jgi:lambda repressor-like predicted transcriptional regulator
MKIVDEFIAKLRKYGVAKASRKSGVSEGTLYSWTNGYTTPTLFLAAIVAEAIGLEFLLSEKAVEK